MSWEGMPAEVSASPLVIGPSMNEGEIIISAAPMLSDGALVTLKGTGAGPEGPIVRGRHPEEEIYLPGGGRGRFAVDTLALAVTDPSDIAVEAIPREIVLAPGETAGVEVTVTRNPRYDKPVNLAMVLQHLGGIHGNPLPPGYRKESGGKTLLGRPRPKARSSSKRPDRTGVRKGPDRRDGARLDQFRRQDGLRERADLGFGPAQVPEMIRIRVMLWTATRVALSSDSEILSRFPGKSFPAAWDIKVGFEENGHVRQSRSDRDGLNIGNWRRARVIGR